MEERTGIVEKLRDFFKVRLENLYQGDASREELTAAINAKATWENLPALQNRIIALGKFRKTEGFAQIVETFKRVSNILKDAPISELNPKALAHPAEEKVFATLEKAESAVRTSVQNQAWDQALDAIATLREPVAELFVAVMINDPDPIVRQNRLALLREVREVVLEVADFAAFQVG